MIVSPLLYSEKLSLAKNILLYKPMIRPIATSESPTWAFQSKTETKRLEAGQIKIQRKIRRAHRYMANNTIKNDL